MDELKYMIGQRVILNDYEIGTVSVEQHSKRLPGHVWVYAPSRGYASCYAKHNVKPLPDGQL